MACEKNKLNVDFYVKTFHMDRYWSATPKERREEYDWYKPQADDHDGNNDNMWCINPEKTAAFMETVEKPWIAFKVMAAGAIPPRMAFSHAFRNGADFIIAGMFDFQVEDDVKIAIERSRRSTTASGPGAGDPSRAPACRRTEQQISEQGTAELRSEEPGTWQSSLLSSAASCSDICGSARVEPPVP